MRHLPALSVAWLLGCGSAATPPVESPPSVEDEATSEESAFDEEPVVAPPSESQRHIAVRWDQLADPLSANVLIVRTDDEWEELFAGSPPDRTMDFGRSIVVGVVQAEMAGVHIDDVRVEGGEVVVEATVELPNPSCGEPTAGSLDLMVIDAVDMHIRFDIQRRTTECETSPSR